MLKTYLDLMHSFPPCKLLQFSFDLDLVETLWVEKGQIIRIYCIRKITQIT